MLHKAISNLKNQDGEGEGGFTLIELLVVILIIGILAAIALPTFLGQSTKAKDSEAKSDARNAVTQMESCLADGSSTPVTCTTDPGVEQFENVEITGTSATSGAYIVTATSDSKNTFLITKSATAAPGAYSRSCTVPADGDEGGCQNVTGGTGSW